MLLLSKKMKEEIIVQDSNSYILLDTNVIEELIDASLDLRNPKKWAKKFYSEIKNKKIELLACDLTIFEFLRGSKSHEEYLEKLHYLEELFSFFVPGVETGDAVDAAIISNLYESKNACKDKQPSFVDIFLVTILKNLSSKNVVLATFNYKDFPLLFLDREIIAIDMGYEIKNLCFYKFNEKRYKEALHDYLKAKYNKINREKKSKKRR